MSSPYPAHGDPSLYLNWGISDADERLRLLCALLASSEMVTLHAGTEGAVVSRLLSIDRTRGTIDLEFNTDDGRRDAFRGLDVATAVAELDRILLQFELRKPELVGVGDSARLRVPLPLRMARLQRRDAYRVAMPSAQPAHLTVAMEGTIASLALIDLSVIGLAFEWEGDSPWPRGAALAECRLHLPTHGPIACALTVRSLDTLTDPFEDPGRRLLRIGCELSGLTPAEARTVQVYVTTVQQRMNRLRPRIG